MLLMVIERFKNKDPKPIGERFKRMGRMMPEGVAYHGSWIDPATARCFQLMEADSVEKLEQWAGRWADLAEFEIVPVVTSQDYWAARESEKKPARLGRTGLHLELTLASLDRAGFALPRQRAVRRRLFPLMAASSQIAPERSIGARTILDEAWPERHSR